MGLMDKLFGKRSTTPAPQPTQRPSPPPPPPPGPEEMTAAQVRALLAADSSVQLIDVREVHELRQSGWIPGARHMPMSTFEGRESEIDRDRPVVVYCASGARSFNVGCHLMDRGFTRVINLAGGIQAWDGERARGHDLPA